MIDKSSDNRRDHTGRCEIVGYLRDALTLVLVEPCKFILSCLLSVPLCLRQVRTPHVPQRPGS